MSILRNLAAHGRDDVSSEQALEFLALAVGVTYQLNSEPQPQGSALWNTARFSTLATLMPVDRPPLKPAVRITPQIRLAVLEWISRNVDYGLAHLADMYLEAEVHPNCTDALVELEERYGVSANTLLGEFQIRLASLGKRHAKVHRQTRLVPVASLSNEDLIALIPPGDRALAFLQCIPEPELLVALEMGARSLVGQRGPDMFAFLERVFRTRGLPYAASELEGITWIGDAAISEHAVEPALSALLDPRLLRARQEFDKSRGHLRRGEFKDAGKAAGDAVETTMAIVLKENGHPQPQTPGGHDLVQAGALFDALKSKQVGVLDQERDYALIFGSIKVRHTCGHGAGANPRPLDPKYVEAGVASAAAALAYLASKLPEGRSSQLATGRYSHG